MDKKGQFFLIAAIVISLIVITLGTVYITKVSPKAPETRIYDLSEEIKMESNQVIDNGVFYSSSLSPQETENRINQLIANYSQTNPDTDLVIVYGNKNRYCIVNYTTEESGKISMGGSSSTQQTGRQRAACSAPSSSGNVSVVIGNATYVFDLKEGQNFYVALKKTIKREQIVAAK